MESLINEVLSDGCNHQFIEDNGHYVCRLCGIVSDEPILYKNFDDRHFMPDKEIYAHNEVYVNKGYGSRTIFDPNESGGNKRRFWRLHKINVSYYMNEERAMSNINHVIYNIISQIIKDGDIDYYTTEAMYMYRKTLKRGILKFRKVDAVAAYFAYQSIRTMMTYPLNLFIERIGVPKRDYVLIAKQLTKHNFNIKRNYTNTVPDIRTMNITEFDVKTINEIQSVINTLFTKYRYKVSGNPNGYIAALYYRYRNLYNMPISQYKAAKKFGITEVTLRTKLRILKSTGLI